MKASHFNFPLTVAANTTMILLGEVGELIK